MTDSQWVRIRQGPLNSIYFYILLVLQSIVGKIVDEKHKKCSKTGHLIIINGRMEPIYNYNHLINFMRKCKTVCTVNGLKNILSSSSSIIIDVWLQCAFNLKWICSLFAPLDNWLSSDDIELRVCAVCTMYRHTGGGNTIFNHSKSISTLNWSEITIWNVNRMANKMQN